VGGDPLLNGGALTPVQIAQLLLWLGPGFRRPTPPYSSICLLIEQTI
jgi:hypothetical protein